MRSAIVNRNLLSSSPAAPLLLGMGLICCQAGCGGSSSSAPDTYQTTGVITYNGAPVANANVAFRPLEGRPATGVTNEAGEFTLGTYEFEDGAVPGDYKVTVVIAPPITDPADETAYEPPADDGDSAIPLVYASQITTPLSATVTEEGPNHFPFELEDQ